ncbi:MAG: deoxyribose-phosphate aldolase [Acidobacteriia bacterium]|nr:deoxyribose-phosphate aldolase [Terriglobia bacterium]
MSFNRSQSDSESSDASRVAGRIQSTIISNVLTHARLEEHIAECMKYRFHAAMVPAAWVKKTAQALRGTEIRTASFIDLPYGTMTSAGKAYEAGRLVQDGVEEIDLMPNVGFLLSGMEAEYAADIRGVVEAGQGVPIKVMLELPLLDARQKERAAALSIEAGAAYLKNASSGAVGVATAEDIRFLRRLAPANIRIKASGGIKTAQQVQELLAAGADLVGSSAGAQIMKELLGKKLIGNRSRTVY